MPEIRKNLLTGDHVIVAPERAFRPHDQNLRRSLPPPAARDPECPFCSGNEAQVPPLTYVDDASPLWRVSAFPNRFSVLDAAGVSWQRSEHTRVSSAAVGPHEVICESSRHDGSLALFATGNVEAVLRAYRDRFCAFYKDARVMFVCLFKNHGPGAGSSLVHPHSQVVGLPMMPAQHRRRAIDAERYFEFVGECPVCRVLQDEMAIGERCVLNGEHFVSVIPWAALSPFHLWILPKRHRPSFGSLEDVELADLASVLRRTLGAIRTSLDDADYNLVVLSAPPKNAASPFLHWYLSIIPRVTQTAGFEMGTAMYVNPSRPEDSAATLRQHVPA